MFNRLESPTSGSIRVAGQDVNRIDPIALRRATGYVQQDGGLLPHWSVERNVELVPQLLGWSLEKRRQRSRSLLASVGLDAETHGRRYPHELSGGQQQRVAFARALAADPPVVLLDEPFGALDAMTRRQLQAEFLSLKRDLHKTMVLVTHDIDEAATLGDRIAVMRAGRLLQCGTFEDLLRRPGRRIGCGARATSRATVARHARRSALIACRRRSWSLGALMTALFLGCGAVTPAAAEETIVVGSKNFAESRLLAEMFAQALEAHTTLRVDRRLGLAGTQVCFEALRTGAIDIYPEYTGTGLVTLLGITEPRTPVAARRDVRQAFRERWDLHWLAPLGFENAYEIAVPRSVAEKHALRSISDLVPVASQLHAAFGYEFLERDDGLPGLERTYGLRFASTRGMQQALKYQAAGERRVDCLDVYTTDGRLLVHDLVVLEDDRAFFPPYEAAALVRGNTLQRHPQVAVVLSRLSGLLSEDAMRDYNRRLENDGAPLARVATQALEDLGVIEGAGTPMDTETLSQAPLSQFWQNRETIARHCLQHLVLALLGLLLGMLVAIPLALALSRAPATAEAVIRLIGTTQTIPSLALLAFMVPLFGVGALPAIIALWIYALFPILRNTYTGVRHADPAAVQAATALGMTPRQVLLQVRLPLAAPVILAGVRTAAVLTVGTATLAAFIGAGGLGELIVSGVQAVDTTLILMGAIPAALLAILVDALLGLLERRVRPPVSHLQQEA